LCPACSIQYQCDLALRGGQDARIAKIARPPQVSLLAIKEGMLLDSRRSATTANLNTASSSFTKNWRFLPFGNRNGARWQIRFSCDAGAYDHQDLDPYFGGIGAISWHGPSASMRHGQQVAVIWLGTARARN
jgi:hypothetical protein